MKEQLLINGFMVEAVYSDETVERVLRPFLRTLAEKQRRQSGRLIAFLAAPPATGKSTLAAFLQKLAGDMSGMPPVQALGMDGFHYHQDYILSHTAQREGKTVPMKQIKGAPESFDVLKLQKTLEDMRTQDITWPVYDRTLHDVVEDAVHVTAPIVLVEGNYLLLDQPVWRELTHDYAVFVLAEETQLRERLIVRKMRGGATEVEALRHYNNCDGPNVRLCLQGHLPCDEVWQMTGEGEYKRT